MAKQMDEIAALKAELERVTRARDIACFNIVELNDKFAKATAALGSALQLVEYMVNEMLAAGHRPSVACEMAKKDLTEKVRKLLGGEP